MFRPEFAIQPGTESMPAWQRRGYSRTSRMRPGGAGAGLYRVQLVSYRSPVGRVADERLWPAETGLGCCPTGSRDKEGTARHALVRLAGGSGPSRPDCSAITTVSGGAHEARTPLTCPSYPPNLLRYQGKAGRLSPLGKSTAHRHTSRRRRSLGTSQSGVTSLDEIERR